jgi:malate dehydrogenase
MSNWINGTPAEDWVSMAVASDGSYGIPEGVVFSYPVTCRNGNYTIVQGLELSDFSRAMLKATDAELREERDGVAGLL